MPYLSTNKMTTSDYMVFKCLTNSHSQPQELTTRMPERQTNCVSTSPDEKEAAIFQDTKSFAILTWPWCRSRPLTDRSPELIVNKEVEEMYFSYKDLHAHVDVCRSGPLKWG